MGCFSWFDRTSTQLLRSALADAALLYWAGSSGSIARCTHVSHPLHAAPCCAGVASPRRARSARVLRRCSSTTTDPLRSAAATPAWLGFGQDPRTRMAPAGVVAHPDPLRLSPVQLGPLRLRGRLLFTCPWMCTPLRLNGSREVSSACSSSASSAQWLTGAFVAPPSHPGTPHFRRKLSSRAMVSWPPSLRGSPQSWAAHPFDGDSHFVSGGVVALLYHGYASSSRLSSRSRRGHSGGAEYLVTERWSYWFSAVKERAANLLDVSFAPGFPWSVLTGTQQVRTD